MNIEDVDLAHAEYDADPVRWRSNPSARAVEARYSQLHHAQTQPAQQSGEQGEQPTTPGVEEVEEQPTRADSLSSTTSIERASTVQSHSSRPRARHADSRLTAVSTQPGTEGMIMDYLDRHPTAIERVHNHRLQHIQTVGSRRDVDLSDLPPFGGGKPYPLPLPDREEYVVEFDSHDDPKHPQNWPARTKLIIALILVFDSLSATFASSVFSAGSTYVGKEFHVGQEVTTLGTSLFVLGYAVGPMIFAPLSELYGRRLPVMVAAFGFGVFNIGVAVAKDYQTLIICRFFAGLFGSAPLTVVAAVFADMYNNEVRGISIAIFSATVICGPFTGPMIGGFISKSYLGWRFTAYIPAFMGFACCILSVLFQKETYGPVILVSKAAELRRRTRNWGIHAKQEEVEVDFKELVVKNISRPLRILFTEPIVLLVTIYMSFIYGLLYLSLTAYSIVFSQIHGFSDGVSGLPYIAMIVGVLIALSIIIYQNKSYVKKLQANNNIPVPEWRMPIVMIGGPLFSLGLFWFGWGGYMSSTPWIVPTLAGLFLGFGIYTVFLSCLNYLVDAYLMWAASVIAANTIMRSLFGAVFPLFASYMFEGIGVNWAMTLLGCVAALFIPMPFLFYRYGRTIRAKSKFAPAIDIDQDKRRDEESKGGESESSSGAKDESKEE